MLDQVTRTSREYPVLPGTTEDQGVLWYMSTVLLTAFGFFYVATPFRPFPSRGTRTYPAGCLHTAEDAGSNPASPTLKIC
jgi:hypothetical protein